MASRIVCRQTISDSWLGNLRECLAHLVKGSGCDCLLVQAASLLDGFSFDLFPPFKNGLTAPEVDVSRRQVVQALVISTVVVVELARLSLELLDLVRGRLTQKPGARRDEREFDQDQSLYRRAKHHGSPERRESLMPIDTIVVVLMAAAFGIFAATLYWADLRTRGLTR